MGYPTEAIEWPTNELIKNSIQDSEKKLFR
jgi:hypothetical protein